jgi:sarcosine oxidase subunit alpha
LARTPRGWPNASWDLGRALDLVPQLWAAGFYNKTFTWPNWHTYEPLIRRMAGLGRAPAAPDPDRYETDNLHCDVLVVGGGRAGLQAALVYGRAGARVILVEQDRQLGGKAAWEQAAPQSPAATEDTITMSARLAQLPNVQMMTRTTAAGFYDHNVVMLFERLPPEEAEQLREKVWIVRAKRVILATGVIEQPLIFAHNDRPGIILAGAAREYLLRYHVAIGRSVVVATNNDSAYVLAIELQRAGVTVLGVADTRRDMPQSIRALLQVVDIPLFSGSIPIDTTGFSALKSVTLGRLTRDGTGISSSHTLKCDALAVSGGLNPALQLYAQAGGKLTYDAAFGALSPRSPLPNVEIVGSASERVPTGTRISPVGPSNRKWVDLLHDVTEADLELAVQENFTGIEHIKRYTTVGMAADQGKTSAAATLEVVGRLRAVAPASLGHTTLRPPVTPVSLGAIAGRETRERFAPYRELPIHEWHLAHGALMQEFGEWRRPVAYLKAGETREQAVRREAHRVRNAAGLFDSSSLGKIEVHGPDALEFLDRFYFNDLTTLKPYRARYGLMLRETGILFDDGTIVMLAKDRFLLTTTSGNAGRVAQWLEEWHQCEWPHYRVAIVPVTECWATVSLAGPCARDLLTRLPSDVDFSSERFPHLAMREGTLCGMPARIYRVSFTGELTYEINVPSEQGAALWQALMEAGADAIEPFGMDALMLLRLEKGFLHLGSDTDGTSIPDDVGWGKVAASKKRDYIGKRSLRLPEYARSDRFQLVGLMTESSVPFVIGSHLKVQGSQSITDGWVTSAGTAVLSGEPIALGMVRSGRARIGQTVVLYDAGAPIARARVVNPPFYDASGDRMNA